MFTENCTNPYLFIYLFALKLIIVSFKNEEEEEEEEEEVVVACPFNEVGFGKE